MSSISSPADLVAEAVEASAAGRQMPPPPTLYRVRAVVARSWWQRARGLLRRPPPARGEGMLFPGCASVHTCFMSYPIDVVYLDRAAVITKVARRVPPWRFSAAGRGTHHVLELAEGEAERLHLKVGQRLRFDSETEASWASWR